MYLFMYKPIKTLTQNKDKLYKNKKHLYFSLFFLVTHYVQTCYEQLVHKGKYLQGLSIPPPHVPSGALCFSFNIVVLTL